MLSVVLPQILPFDFGEEPINSGDSTSITCSISKGDLPINITWTLNGKPIQMNEYGIKINQVTKKLSALSIDYVDANHVGEYSCVAANKAGVSLSTAYLHVNGIRT